MKTSLVLVALAVMQACARAGIETDIPATNRVVLKSGDWTPAAEEEQKALLSIQSFLDRPGNVDDYSKADIKVILRHTKEYRVQFIGVVRDGRKVIWCNFFPAPHGDRDNFPYWKQQKVKVFDGGFRFWHIDYDPDTDKCSEFYANGSA